MHPVKRFVGLDIHKRAVEVCIVEGSGKVVHRFRVPCTREALQEFAEHHLTAADALALEATFHTWAVVAALEPFVAEIVVSNPLRTKAIAQAKIKTDRVDAEVLAQLLRCEYLPRVWQPDAATQRLRRLTSRRAALVADRTAIKNRLHSVLAQRLIVPPLGDSLFRPKGLAWLATLALDPDGRQMLDSDLRQLAATEREIAALDDLLARAAYPSPEVKLLMTLPGVDVAVAQTLLAALGEISRFRTGDHAASYLGLVPSTHQSGEHCYHGPITKHGRGHTRWMLVQAAQHLSSHPGPLGVFFRRLAKKKNRNVAVVATARKLVVIAWHMLRHHEPYRYAQPHTVQAKLSRLRVKATGRRRTTGPAKGTPPTATRGTGQRTRAVPSLPEVYLREELPAVQPPTALPPGELRHLRQSKTLGFIRQIQQPRRHPRPTAKTQDQASTEPGGQLTQS